MGPSLLLRNAAGQELANLAVLGLPRPTPVGLTCYRRHAARSEQQHQQHRRQQRRAAGTTGSGGGPHPGSPGRRRRRPTRCGGGGARGGCRCPPREQDKRLRQSCASFATRPQPAIVQRSESVALRWSPCRSRWSRFSWVLPGTRHARGHASRGVAPRRRTAPAPPARSQRFCCAPQQRARATAGTVGGTTTCHSLRRRGSVDATSYTVP